MAYAQLSTARPLSTGSGDLRRVARSLLSPLVNAHRRLLQRQRLEALSDRLLLDVGIEREDLPSLLRRI